MTGDRRLWLGRPDVRWLRALPLGLVHAYTELVQTHRYGVVLDHEPVEFLMWAPQHRYPWGTWGDGEEVQAIETSTLAFSRRDTDVAEALRARLDALGVMHSQRTLARDDGGRGRMKRPLKRGRFLHPPSVPPS